MLAGCLSPTHAIALAWIIQSLQHISLSQLGFCWSNCRQGAGKLNNCAHRDYFIRSWIAKLSPSCPMKASILPHPLSPPPLLCSQFLLIHKCLQGYYRGSWHKQLEPKCHVLNRGGQKVNPSRVLKMKIPSNGILCVCGGGGMIKTSKMYMKLN